MSIVVYTHTDIHGNTITVTDATAHRTWSGYHGPYGEPASGANPPTTSVPGTAWRYLGDQQRLTDNNLIHMGARDYNPTLGRFLQVDPIEGGCANAFVYVYGDPIMATDVSGKGCGYIGDIASFFSPLSWFDAAADIIRGDDATPHVYGNVATFVAGFFLNAGKHSTKLVKGAAKIVGIPGSIVGLVGDVLCNRSDGSGAPPRDYGHDGPPSSYDYLGR